MEVEPVSRDRWQVAVVLRCLAPPAGSVEEVEWGFSGGPLVAICASAIQGELPQLPMRLLPTHVTGWVVGNEEEQWEASWMVRSLCRRCCLPSLVLRCLKVKDGGWGMGSGG